MPEQRAEVGQTVHLTAQVVDALEGDEVEFKIKDADDETIEELAAPIADGVARTAWVVQLDGRTAPQTLTFQADCLGSRVSSETLVVEGGALQASGGWLVARDAQDGQVSFEAPGGTVEDDGSFLAGDQVIEGTGLIFRVEIAAGGDAVGGPLSGTFIVEQDPGSGFAPIGAFTGESQGAALAIQLHMIAGGRGPTRVLFEWTQGDEAGPKVTSPTIVVREPGPPPPPPPGGNVTDGEAVEIQLHDGLLRPAGTTAYTLELPGGETRSGFTDTGGWLIEAMPPGSFDVIVRFQPVGSTQELALTIAVTEGGTDAAYLAHIRNMGFSAENDQKTVLRFQAARNLALSGELDGDTKAAVDALVATDEPLGNVLGKSNE